MLNDEIKLWYSKKDIEDEYPLSEREIRRRLSKSVIPKDKLKLEKSSRGLPKKLYHYSILDNIFRRRRCLSEKEKDYTIKWVNNHYWKYTGNIVPKESSIDINIKIIHLIYEDLKQLTSKNTILKVFYSIEPNPEDNYYHSHFLIDCNMSKISRKDILNILEKYVDTNTSKVRRIDLKKYNHSLYNKQGSKYTTKIKGVYELLENKV